MKFRHNGRLNRQWHRILGVYMRNHREYKPPAAWWRAWEKSVRIKPGGPLGRRYVLVDGKPVVCRNLFLWGSWLESADDPRRVAQTTLPNGKYVSTVFLGLDHRMFGSGPPVLWETMVFDDGDLNGGDYQERYTSEREARHGHDVMCAVASLRVDTPPQN